MTPAQIKAIRKNLGMSQESFADRLGVSFATVNRWENGKSAPHSDRLMRLNKLENHKGHDTFSDMVDHWTGRLILAIGAGSFRTEVATLLSVVMKDAYERGARKDALIE